MRYFSAKKSVKQSLQSEFERVINKNFSFKHDCNYVEDINYEKLIYSAKKLCAYNNVSVNSTTIEGLLINANNVDLFIDFCLESFVDKKDILLKIQAITDAKEKSALLRLFFFGKLDCCVNEVVSINEFKTKQKITDTKADGWINKWLNWFIDKKCPKENDNQAQEVFKQYFPEFFETLQMIKCMI